MIGSRGFILIDAMVALVILGIAVMIVTTSVSNSVPHLERVTNELRDQRILRNYALLKDSPAMMVAAGLAMRDL